MINVVIDGIQLEVEENSSIMHAALSAGIDIPRLCYHPDLKVLATCGLCIVEIEGYADPQRACATLVQNGMVVTTQSASLRQIRRTILELILASHPTDCLECIRHGNCELEKLAERFEIRDLEFNHLGGNYKVDESSWGIVRDMNKCIGCGRCVEVCTAIQSVGSISFQGRGSNTVVAPARNQNMGSSVCTNCGQCVVYCPVGALHEKEYVEDVWTAISDKSKIVVAQVAPSVRVALGEMFGMVPGELVIGKIYAALRKLGVDVVFDTNFSADLTIMEEGNEFLERLNSGGPFPLITSCSPGWVKFAETYYPELLENISSAKSPQQMMGAIIKTYYANKNHIKAEDIVSLSIMPCTAKKFEANRDEMNASGQRDVDYVLTTREFARMLKEQGIDFANLAEEKADPVLSDYSGAGTIFGASGGVMEAALRTAYELQTKKLLQRLEFSEVRGILGVKEATVDVEGVEVRVAVASGLANARLLLDRVLAAKSSGQESPYHFIEIMTCRCGCVGGGGQPIDDSIAQREKRINGLYREDENKKIRKSHENPEVLALYNNFLGHPGSKLAHKLLHTQYHKRSKC